MSSLLFSLVFTYSGVSYTLYNNLSIHQCVGKLYYERTAIAEVQKRHPNMIMKVECLPSKAGNNSVLSSSRLSVPVE